MNERETALKVANMWLDGQMNPLVQMVPGDPDCDACTVGRQLIRAHEAAGSLRRELDHEVRETATLADQCAFWAYQAKWYYAKVHCKADYDSLPRATQDSIDQAFERARIAENRERIGHIPDSYDIGS